MVALSHQAKKCPDEPGETGMMESAVLGWVSQGLQHEVIAMASCCKKGGGQKGNNCHRQTCTGTTGITVLSRDSGVVAGFEPARRSFRNPLPAHAAMASMDGALTNS